MKAFFLPPDEPPSSPGIKEAPLPSLIALVVTALGSIALFFYPKLLYDLMALVVGP